MKDGNGLRVNFRGVERALSKKLLMKVVSIKSMLMVVIATIGLVVAIYLAGSSDERWREFSGAYSVKTIRSESITRQFSFYRPLDLSAGAALIFVLHGSMGSGDSIREETGYEFDMLADQRGVIVVYPDGYKNHWNDCRGEADYVANIENVDDIVFFKDMINFFVRQEGVDPERIYVAGHSNGGQMAYRLALEAPEVFQAIAVVSASLPSVDNLDCEESSLPVSIAMFNGTEDELNPYDGGLVAVAGNTSRGLVRSSLETARYWKQLAGIESSAVSIVHPETDGVIDTSTYEQRWSSGNGTEVRLYTLRGSGHAIPRTALSGDAENQADISAPSEIVSFFLER